MVRFDGNRRPVNRYRFNYIRIYGSLPKEFYPFYGMCLLVKNINETVADCLSFIFRHGFDGQFGIKVFTGIYAFNVKA